MNDKIIRLLVIAAGVLVFLLVAFLKERRKNRQPTIQIRAEITAIRLDNLAVRGAYGATNRIGHYVTFHTAEGELLELSAPEDVGHLPIGTTGTLTYQGSKCERFDPENVSS